LASLVLAEKRKATADGASVGVVDAVANILGIKDTKNINMSTSLADLGMDSLMGAEIKQTLERNFDLVLSVQEIRNLTMGKLDALQNKGDSTDSEKTTDKTATATKETTPKTNSDPLVQFLDVTTLMPSKTVTLLESQADGKTNVPNVFFIHPVEGLVSALKNLASVLPYRVYGIECTQDTPLDSVESIASFYVQHLRSVQKRGPYNITGYSFGASVAFEIALQLESKGEQVNVVLLDGSPEYISKHTGAVRAKRSPSDTGMAAALTQFISIFKEDDRSQMSDVDTSLQLEKDLSKSGSEKSMLDVVVDVLKDTVPYEPSDVAAAAKSFFYKLAAGDSYKPKAAFAGDVHLVRAQDNFLSLDEDYGLKTVCKKPVKVFSVKGNHREILSIEESVKEIARVIKSAFGNV
jgi:fatty acid synthase